MNHQRHNMLSIGSFANASGLSLKALRLYAQLNILAPSFVDPDSGYRYYAPDQLAVARRIRLMRQMAMPLAIIRQVLAAAPAEAERLVRAYWQMRETQMELDRQVVQTLVLNLRQEATAMTLEVHVKTIDPQPIISITRRIKVEQLHNHIVSSLDTLFALAQANGVAPAGPPLGIYHGPVNHEEDGPMEVVLPLQRALTATGDAKSRELSGGTVASVMMHGDQCQFPAILAGYDAVFDWVRQQGYEVAEAPREIWHSEPGANAQMEIALPFREAAGA